MTSSSSKLRGVFLNQPQAQCSIYESGMMVYRALQLGDRYSLAYFELTKDTAHQIPAADFYLFNYHHVPLEWLDTSTLSSLPGKKITMVLEMLPGNPFVYVSPEHFDAYLVLDPTMNIGQRNVYGFPRPLEPTTSQIAPYVEKDIPWIGTFGFSTPGKGFELVIDAVNREFDRALVRINIPVATYADDNFDYLSKLCRSVAKPGVEVNITRDFMTKEQLIDWCGQNTLNCFLYCRNQPGLSATTDQCITVGRPLAVSANETFRHIHHYLKPYPVISLRDAIKSSVPAVLQMREDWTPKNFALRFEHVLADLSLLPSPPAYTWKRKPPEQKETILVVSDSGAHPGNALSMQTMAKVLSKSKRYTALHVSSQHGFELRSIAQSSNAKAVLYLTSESGAARELAIPGIALRPSGSPSLELPRRHREVSMMPAQGEHVLPRVLPLNCNEQRMPEVPTVGCHFFGPDYTQCENAIERVKRDFGRAHMIIYLPAISGDPVPAEVAQRCFARAGADIALQFIHELCGPDKLFSLMGYPSLHYFPGTSAQELVLLDYALSTQRPIAVGPSPLFAHLGAALPAISAESNTLRAILENGLTPLVPLYNDLSEARFLIAAEALLDTALHPQTAVSAAPFANRVISKDLESTFIFETVEHYAKGATSPRVLAVGSFNHSASVALRKLGIPFEEVDPRLNFDVETFYSLATTVLASYDVIFAPSMLEEVEDDQMFVAQLADLLAPGGVMILTCEYNGQAKELEERYLPILQGCAWSQRPEWSASPGTNRNVATLVIERVPAS